MRRLLANAIVVVMVILFRTNLTAAEPQTTSPKSFFLVASRSMPDPVFQQSVILMLPPDEPPLVAGVIINKPTDVSLGNLLKEPLASDERNQKVYFGGPVDLNAPLLVIRTSRPPRSAIQLWSNVYAVSDPASIANVLRAKGSSIRARFFLGRTQWAQEQLRGELLEGAWSVVPLKTDLIFDPDSAKISRLLNQHEHVREIDTTCHNTSFVLNFMMCRGAI